MKPVKKRKRKDFEIRFYESLVENNPQFIDAISCLAAAYTRKGFYQEGLSLDKRLTVHKPQDPIVFYNLACSYSLVGDLVQSLEALTKALSLGYNDLRHLIEDPDLENLRTHPSFRHLLGHIAEGVVKA